MATGCMPGRCHVRLRTLAVVCVTSSLLTALALLLGSPLAPGAPHLLGDPEAVVRAEENVTSVEDGGDDDVIEQEVPEMQGWGGVTWYRNGSSVLASILRGKEGAKCVGSNETLGEVEDLLCLPRPDYDRRMKNPCWWERITPRPPGNASSPGAALPPPAPRGVDSLSCLPYFHILCCSKSGTTDLYRRLSIHPDIVPNLGIFGKERLFWGWAKYGYRYHAEDGTPVPFYKYIRGFSILARYLEKAVVEKPKDLQRLVTLDGSPPDMWDFRGWITLPQNRGLRKPDVVTPHLMRHLYRNPRFIILVREPVERLFTGYLFLQQGKSAEEFHWDVLRSAHAFARCLSAAQDRIECFVNASVTSQSPVDIHYSCYAVYFEEWFKVFPRRHFLFMRTEDYSADVKDSLFKVIDFLDMSRPSSKDMKKMVSAPLSYHTRQRDVAGPMWNETRDLLRQLYRPWNQELARLMKDDAFLWNDVYEKS